MAKRSSSFTVQPSRNQTKLKSFAFLRVLRAFAVKVQPGIYREDAKCAKRTQRMVAETFQAAKDFQVRGTVLFLMAIAAFGVARGNAQSRSAPEVAVVADDN